MNATLGERLARLRGEAGAGPPRTGRPPGPLQERLARLTRARGRAAAGGRAVDAAALARALGGRVLAPGLVAVEERLEGEVAGLDPRAVAEAAGELAATTRRAAATAPRALAFLDTETSGLAGGTGTTVFLLGIGRFEGGTLHLCQLVLAGFAGEAAMLAEGRRRLAGASLLVSYNGRSFDAPLIAARARLARCPDPLAGLAHLDLLAPTRAAFARRWPDCRLAGAERRLLGLERADDLPGALAPAAWLAWLRGGRCAALSRVCAHNRQDLVSLALLLPALRRCHRDPLAWGADPRVLARARGERAALAYLRERRGALDAAGLRELGRLARRGGEWALATEAWQRLAAAGDPEGHERLAKYHEHVAREPARALVHARALLALEPEREAHRQRLRRLLRIAARRAT